MCGLTHWYAQETDGQLDAADDVERPGDPPVHEPIIRTIGEREGEEILENKQQGEGFECQILCRISSAN